MSDRANQHIVPQFYFRNFTGGSRAIHLLQKSRNRIILNAGIRGQCARHKFYGPRQLEGLLSQLESRHSRAIRDAIAFAWQSGSQFTTRTLSHLWEAVLLQRARTEIEIEKHFPAMEAFALEAFKNHLRYAPGIEDRERLIAPIEKGQVRLVESSAASVWRYISVALENVILLSDLDFHIIRNHSGLPFVFGDAPVVLCNTYYQNVKSRGVLGLQTPGLQIFFPLDSRTLLMLLDEKVYSGAYFDSIISLLEISGG